MRIPRHFRAALVALAIALTVGAPTASAGDIEIRRDGSKAVYVPAAPPAASSSDSADGFHAGDAGIGAAGMLALVLGAAGVASLYGRRPFTRHLPTDRKLVT
jgi:hypothetical protein